MWYFGGRLNAVFGWGVCVFTLVFIVWIGVDVVSEFAL